MIKCIIEYATIITEILLCCSLFLIFFRLVLGPDISDRIVALDFLYIIFVIFSLVLAIHYNTPYYWNISLVICLLGFVSGAILIKFVLGRVVNK